MSLSSGARRLAIAAAGAWLVGCTALPRASEVADRTTEPADFTLRLIGARTLAHRLQFGGTTVGGLSGIDYDPVDDLYYLISDDRSAFAPTRFYTAKLRFDAMRFDDVGLQSVVTLKRPDGSPFPVRAADAESIRYDARTRSLWWTSEGERGGPTRLVQPFVRRSARDGHHIDEVPLAPMFRVTTEPRGPRDNIAFEGLTLSVDGRSLWVAMEGPLIQDGAMPTMREGAWTRISRHDRDASGNFGPVQAQFAYRVDPIPSSGASTALFAQTGVSEILALDERRVLVLERAFVLGTGWRIRLYVASWQDATDVGAIDSLVDPRGPPFVPMTKRLVLDFDTLPITIDNLEGLCFGPTLPNGHRTLVLVSDDNFDPGQSTQFIAFEIVPR